VAKTRRHPAYGGSVIIENNNQKQRQAVQEKRLPIVAVRK